MIYSVFPRVCPCLEHGIMYMLLVSIRTNKAVAPDNNGGHCTVNI